jgi:hypothetical protein
MKSVDVGGWNANWAWSLPLIVLNVIIHVVGLGLINESIVRLPSGVLSRGRFVLMFALVLGLRQGKRIARSNLRLLARD